MFEISKYLHLVRFYDMHKMVSSHRGDPTETIFSNNLDRPGFNKESRSLFSCLRGRFEPEVPLFLSPNKGFTRWVIFTSIKGCKFANFLLKN